MSASPVPGAGIVDTPAARRRLRLLVFNMAMDADDPVLGFVLEWVRALAERAEQVDVITMRGGRHDMPANVRVCSVGKERGLGEPRRALEFYRILLGWLRHDRYDACFAHMIPIFALMASPLLKLRGVPITLWYTHGAAPKTLLMTERVVDRVVTASAESFTAPSRKLVVTGHGIATRLFTPGSLPSSADRTVRVLAVGRIAPVKRLEVLVDALAEVASRVGVESVEARLVGPVADADRSYASALVERARRLEVEGALRLVGPVPLSKVVDEYRWASVVVSMTEVGSFDKVVLEAMSCGVPVLTPNGAFEPLLGGFTPNLLLADSGAAAVAAAVLNLASMAPAESAALGRQLREMVVREHSLDRLCDLLVDRVLVRRAADGI